MTAASMNIQPISYGIGIWTSAGLTTREKNRGNMTKNKTLKTIILRNVPEPLRRRLKAMAAKEGKSMQGLVLELITRYVKGEK